MSIVQVSGRNPVLARGCVIARAGIAYLPALAFGFVTFQMLAIAGDRWALPRVQDDAFYYLAIAKNIALHGRSELAPGVATNGYQPLWMLAIVAAGSLFGFTLTMLKALDLAVVFTGLALFVWSFGVRELLASFCATMVLWYVLDTCALNGMESSLLFPGLVLLVAAFLSPQPLLARHRSAILFLASALCVGARIDAALFVLPLLAIAPVRGRAKLAIAGALAAAGVVYAACNYAAFGAAWPVSGTAKSLGGLQLNTTYLTQLGQELDPARLLRMRSAVTPYLTGLAVLAFAIVLSRRGRARLERVRSLLLVGLVGLGFFGVRLMFFSSWGVWPWYGYPTLFFVLIGLWLVECTAATHWARSLQAVVGVCLAIAQLQAALADRPAGFAGVSRRFIENYATVLRGEPVAMGDRAGSFGFDYPGGVYQLEGLVNDVAYLDVLRTPMDLREHLCRSGVPVVVSYEAPLGDYREHRIEVLRPQLTHHRGPHLTVQRSEEIASWEDVTQFREPNHRIYAWRLDCSVAHENAAGSMTRPRSSG